VGVSLSCESVWFIDAGRVAFIDMPVSPRFLSQHDRIEIADGLACGEPVKAIAARIGKSYQSVYREIARNRKPDGRYQPWYAHGRPIFAAVGPGRGCSRPTQQPPAFATTPGNRPSSSRRLHQSVISWMTLSLIRLIVSLTLTRRRSRRSAR
jgi:hypothetical protein